MTQSPESNAELVERAIVEMNKVIVGQDRVIERMVACVIAQGHCLLEGVPGLAKTLAAETLARVTGGTFHRLQFTPDLVPADIVGTRIYRASSESFDIELGPIFANFVLADEINRAPAKVQSALLEVMAERQVSIGGKTFPAPDPFLVVATQNPIESEGVYPLPEAQRDRFLMKLLVDYPSGAEELEVVRRMGVNPPEADAVLSVESFLDLQQAAKEIHVDPRVADYAVRLVLATRNPSEHGLAMLDPYIAFGASPRASLGLVAAGRALALMRGRTFLLPQDVFDVAPEVLRHRIVLSYEALADGITVTNVLDQLLGTVGAPRIVPAQDETAQVSADAVVPAPVPAAYAYAPTPPQPAPYGADPTAFGYPAAPPPPPGAIDDLTPGAATGERPAS